MQAPPRTLAFGFDVRPAEEDDAEEQPAAAAEPRRVVVRVCETDFARGGLGWRVWGAAHVLARELAAAPRSLLQPRAGEAPVTVLELGAGCGLCGLLAAALGARDVVLTDALPALLDTLAAGAALQSCDAGGAEQQPLPPWTWRGAAPGSRIRVRTLLWDDDVAACGDATAARSATEAAFARSMLAAQLRRESAAAADTAPALDAAERFELVIGSDLLYDWSAVRPLTATVLRRLAPGGLCLLALPVRDKPLLDALAEGLTRAGLAWDARPSAPPSEAPRSDDTGGDEPLACVDLRIWHPAAPPARRWQGWPQEADTRCDDAAR